MVRSAPHPWHGTPIDGARSVVVGVIPGQSPAVVRGAAALAGALGAHLVCVWADAARTLVSQGPDGTLVTTPLDPDHADHSEDEVTADAELAAEVAANLAGVDVPWRFVYTAGEATRALARAGRDHDACMIAVGNRRPGLGGWMNHLVGGSVAGRLSHTQPLPVTIISQESP